MLPHGRAADVCMDILGDAIMMARSRLSFDHTDGSRNHLKFARSRLYRAVCEVVKMMRIAMCIVPV